MTATSDSIVFNGPVEVNAFRMLQILRGLALEGRTQGRMRMTAKAPKCSTMVRQEFGITGNRAVQYDKFRSLLVAMGLGEVKERTDWDEKGALRDDDERTIRPSKDYTLQQLGIELVPVEN